MFPSAFEGAGYRLGRVMVEEREQSGHLQEYHASVRDPALGDYAIKKSVRVTSYSP